MRLIGLMGKSKSGKDTVGAMMRNHDMRGGTLAFADKLKETVMDLFGATYDDVYTEAGKDRDTGFPCHKCPACGSIDAWLEAPTQVVCRKCTAVGEPAAFKSSWTWRMVLQHVGTESLKSGASTRRWSLSEQRKRNEQDRQDSFENMEVPGRDKPNMA